MPLVPLVESHKVSQLWVPEGSRTGHLIRCERCRDAILSGNVIFWEPDTGDERDIIPFCPPCAAWYRENQWWAKKKLIKAEQVLRSYGRNMDSEGKVGWKQAEIDALALKWGLEKRRRWY